MLPAFLLASYLIGSIPFGLILARLIAGVDIRTVGSGNIGATNVGRTIGWKWFPLVMGLDFLKGFGPAVATAMLLGRDESGVLWQPTTLAILAGLVAMIGHLYPIYLRFRGGKGMATGTGVVAGLALWMGWWPILAALATFLLSLLVWRYVSLSSMLAVIAYGVLQLVLMDDPASDAHIAVSVFSVLGPALVIFRHRSNIVRLFQGTENRVGKKSQ
jgi:glycerol-3-phosphate acyltransferase PlsY